jgi:hypothetical protein
MALNTMTPVSNWVQFYGHHHKFVDYYEIAISQMALDLFPFVLFYLSNHTFTRLEISPWVSNKKQEQFPLGKHISLPPFGVEYEYHSDILIRN